jgi:hypothetical protein
VQLLYVKRALLNCTFQFYRIVLLVDVFRIISRYGLAGSSNTTGDDQKKLDVLANELFINMLKSSYTVYVMASEENEHFIEVEVPKQVEDNCWSLLSHRKESNLSRENMSSVLIHWMVHRILIV